MRSLESSESSWSPPCPLPPVPMTALWWPLYYRSLCCLHPSPLNTGDESHRSQVCPVVSPSTLQEQGSLIQRAWVHPQISDLPAVQLGTHKPNPTSISSSITSTKKFSVLTTPQAAGDHMRKYMSLALEDMDGAWHWRCTSDVPASLAFRPTVQSRRCHHACLTDRELGHREVRQLPRGHTAGTGPADFRMGPGWGVGPGAFEVGHEDIHGNLGDQW